MIQKDGFNHTLTLMGRITDRLHFLHVGHIWWDRLDEDPGSSFGGAGGAREQALLTISTFIWRIISPSHNLRGSFKNIT